MTVIGLQDLWPLWPGIVFSSDSRRFGHHLQRRDARTALTDRCADAVVAGISAANHHHMLPGCANGILPAAGFLNRFFL